MSAAQGTAFSIASPTPVWEGHKKFFNFAASTSQLTAKQLTRFEKLMKKDPTLVHVRASKMNVLVPDGFTPVHAAAYAGNLEVIQLLINFQIPSNNECGSSGISTKEGRTKGHTKKDTNDSSKDTSEMEVDDDDDDDLVYAVSLDTRDMQGRTALHIASEQGHIPIVQLLKAKMKERHPQNLCPVGEDAPTDLTGRTPLGWAATSREVRAKQYRKELQEELFHPGDVSVFGQVTPSLSRVGGKCLEEMHSTGREHYTNQTVDLGLSFGLAEMPGYRIEMEDAMICVYPLHPPTKEGFQTPVGFFGVFDGHGDGGIASRYVAEHIVPCLEETEEWKSYEGGSDALARCFDKACADLDVDLRAMVGNKKKGNHGGSTGIMAIVTLDTVVVGNIGDSRCILVQAADGTDDVKDLGVEEISHERKDDKKESTQQPDEPQSRLHEDKASSSSFSSSICVVKALSVDHKPDLPEEKERIEKAGLEVVGDSFEENGELQTIYKIKKSEGGLIAVSRAFGDFDYKSNKDLKSEEQGIVCIPDVTIHKRDPSRDRFLVLACDGVWDVMSNEQVGEFVLNKVEHLKGLQSTLSPTILPEVGDELLKTCLELGSTDNMSVLVIAFPNSNDMPPDHQDSATRTLDFAQDN